MSEEWRAVLSYEGLYEVSSLGRVRSLIHRRGNGIFRGHVDRYGYQCVTLTKDGSRRNCSVHRLVCSAFNGAPPEKTECGHRNGEKSDNHAENLEWITRSENMRDRVRHGQHKHNGNLLIRAGADHPQARYSDEVVAAIRADARLGLGERRLARKYGVSRSHAHRLVRNQRRPEGQAPDTALSPPPVGLD